MAHHTHNLPCSGKASDPILTELAQLEGKRAKGQKLTFAERMQAYDLVHNMPDEGDLDYYTKIHELAKHHRNHCTDCYAKRFCTMEYEARALWFKAWSVVYSARKKHNTHVKGPRELTLTFSDKWGDADAAKTAFKLAEERLLKYYKHELVTYRSVGEYTKSGFPHLHILYSLESGNGFTDKNLKRAYPHWDSKVKVGKGNQGGHHSVVESIANFAGYIEKDLDTAWHSYDITNADESRNSPSGSSSCGSSETPSVRPSRTTVS